MRPGTDDGLRLILEGTLAETGRGFFRALVRNLCRALGTTGAWVTERVPDRARLRSLAFWWKDGHVENHEYDLAGTPCGQVIAQKRLVHCPESVVDLFPEDPNLDRFGAVGFLGVPLFRSREEVLGHLAVLDTKPLPPNRRMATLLEIFAARAAAEYRGLEFESRLRGRARLLARILETSTDGILVFDEARTIVRSNPEADRLFLGWKTPPEFEPGSDADLGLLRASPAPATSTASSGLVGRGIAALFDEVSRSELERAIRGLLQAGEFRLGQRYSMDLVAARIDGSTFPVELALSAFEDGRGRFLTAILRNARGRGQGGGR
jgi:PAS domain-containing protein